MNPTQPAQPATPPAAAPQTVNTAPQNVTPTQLFPVARTVVKDAQTGVQDVLKHWKSPAFWTHALIQALTWLSYFQTVSTPIKIGSLTVSGVSLLGYLWHLASALNSSKS